MHRFWSKVEKTESCWNWKAAKSKAGYGVFHLGRGLGTINSHRFVFQMKYGEIHKGLFVCHTCDNPACLNPDHLFLGTQKDNMMDMVKKGRANPMKGEKNHWTTITEDMARYIKNKVLEGIKVIDIHRETGVNYNIITDIKRNKSWRWIK